MSPPDGNNPVAPAGCGGCLLVALAFGFIAAGAIGLYVSTFPVSSSVPEDWERLAGPKAPPGTAIVSGTVAAAPGVALVKAPVTGRPVVAFKLYLDQVRTGPYPWEEQRSKRQSSSAYGGQLARLLTLDRAVPFRVHTAHGWVAVRGRVGAIHSVTGGRVPGDSEIHDRSPSLPAWTHALPGLKSPLQIQAKTGYVYYQKTVEPEYDVTVVGRRHPSGAIEAPPTGLVMYLASREHIESRRLKTDRWIPTYELIILGVMLLGLRWWARA